MAQHDDNNRRNNWRQTTVRYWRRVSICSPSFLGISSYCVLADCVCELRTNNVLGSPWFLSSKKNVLKWYRSHSYACRILCIVFTTLFKRHTFKSRVWFVYHVTQKQKCNVTSQHFRHVASTNWKKLDCEIKYQILSVSEKHLHLHVMVFILYFQNSETYCIVKLKKARRTKMMRRERTRTRNSESIFWRIFHCIGRSVTVLLHSVCKRFTYKLPRCIYYLMNTTITCFFSIIMHSISNVLFSFY